MSEVEENEKRKHRSENRNCRHAIVKNILSGEELLFLTEWNFSGRYRKAAPVKSKPIVVSCVELSSQLSRGEHFYHRCCCNTLLFWRSCTVISTEHFRQFRLSSCNCAVCAMKNSIKTRNKRHESKWMCITEIYDTCAGPIED